MRVRKSAVFVLTYRATFDVVIPDEELEGLDEDRREHCIMDMVEQASNELDPSQMTTGEHLSFWRSVAYDIEDVPVPALEQLAEAAE